MARSNEPPIQASAETIRSLAKKLEAYIKTLSEQERALFEHLLLTALPPLKRRDFLSEDGLLSQAEAALLDSLTSKR